MAASKKQTMTFKEFELYLHDAGLYETLSRICANHFVRLRDVHGTDRSRSACRARVACWIWLTENGNRSSLEIANLFSRDSTTILYALQKQRSAKV